MTAIGHAEERSQLDVFGLRDALATKDELRALEARGHEFAQSVVNASTERLAASRAK